MRYLRDDDSEKIAEREIVSRVFLVRCNRTSAAQCVRDFDWR